MEITPKGFAPAMLALNGYGHMQHMYGPHQDATWTWNKDRINGLNEQELSTLIEELIW